MKASTRSSNLWAILADDDDIWHIVREMAMTMESIMKEDIWGFFHASMLDPSQQELINESTAKPMQLNEQEYQSFCELINHEHPANDHERFVLSQQALSMQRISIRACLIALQALKIAISCFSPVTSQHPSTYKRPVLFRRSFSTHPYHMIRSATLRCESWARLTLPMVMLIHFRNTALQGGFSVMGEPALDNYVWLEPCRSFHILLPQRWGAPWTTTLSMCFLLIG